MPPRGWPDENTPSFPRKRESRAISRMDRRKCTVIPPKAGIQCRPADGPTKTHRHSRKSGNPEPPRGWTNKNAPSFPRKRESRAVSQMYGRKVHRHSRESGNPEPSRRCTDERYTVIPAKAGIQYRPAAERTKTHRHSRENGNLGPPRGRTGENKPSFPRKQESSAAPRLAGRKHTVIPAKAGIQSAGKLRCPLIASR